MTGNTKRTIRIIEKTLVFASFVLIFAYVIFSRYSENKAKQITLKSRYTFAVTINSDGNVVEPQDSSSVTHTLSQDFANLDIGQIGAIWTREFLAQYSQKYLTWSKRLSKIQIEEPEILDDSNDIVLISFSAALNDTNTDNFEEWEGVLEDGRMHCEWVVEFIIDNHYDGTATIYVSSIMTPEDYGIEQDTKNNVSSVVIEDATESSYAYYQIKDNFLSVTYDGGAKFINVPVDITKLPLVDNGTTGTQTLSRGSYVVSTSTTAFLYGGTTSGTSKTPLTVVYSTDLGSQWTTCEIDNEYGAQYYYLEFFDESNGVIVAEYRGDDSTYSKIYITSNGGSSWTTAGQGPSTGSLKGVKFISAKTGFFAYEYDENVDSNLYKTTDGAKTFEKIYLSEQKLESAVAAAAGDGATWSSVFREATVPVLDKNSDIIVYLTQGTENIYNNGRTAAKYISTDRGVTFKYSGLVEITNE
jgi:hypothetical protein